MARKAATTKRTSKRTRSSKANKKGMSTSSLKGRVLNLRPDALDPRDHPFLALGVAPGATSLPAIVDHSPHTKPVGDQGATGSCVGWATSYGLRRWLHWKETGKKLHFSVRYVWMSSKEIDPWTPNVAFDGAGTRIREAFKIMNKYGACRDKMWPFGDPLPTAQESAIMSDARKYRIGLYHALSTNDERRLHLQKQGPFVIGVPVHTNWRSIGTDGIVPSPAGALLGGHAVLVVGYDDHKKLFKLQNSWGKDWGDKGFGYFPYDYVANHSWNSWGAEL